MKWIRIILWKLALLPVCMVAQNLSEASTISLLTASPVPEHLVSLFGHTALRVSDPGSGIDYVFNYGMFDESLSGIAAVTEMFKGDLQCEMWVVPFSDFLDATRKENRRLVEHSLHLLPDEKNLIWKALINNAKEENRTYVFDFFRRNCTTFPRDLITDNLGKRIVLPDHLGEKTYLQITSHYVRPYPWIHFFIDLISGQNMDKKASSFESLFIPRELETAWLSAHVEDGRPLIASSTIRVEGSENREVNGGSTFLTPLFCAWVLLALIVALSVVEWRRKTYYKWLNVVLFGFTGLFGIVFCVFKLGYAPWYALTDWMLLWIHPLHLIAAVYMIASPFARFLRVYHAANLLLLSFLMAGVFFLPQGYNAAFFPFMACLWLRSLLSVSCKAPVWHPSR